jgi:hypothetical protein
MRRIFALVVLLALVAIQPARATVAVVQAKGQISNGSGTQTSVTVSGLTTPVNGDMMILAVMCANSGALFTTPSGWTKITAQASGSGQLGIFGRIASGESTSYTVSITGTSDYPALAFIEFSGAASTVANALSQFSVISAGSTSNVDASVSLTPAVLSEMPIMVADGNTGMGVSSLTALWTQQFSSYISSKNGNGYVPNYDSLSVATGPITTSTVTPITATTTWNLTAANGPTTRYWSGLIAPAGTGTTAYPRIVKSFPVNASTFGFRRR